MEQHDLYVWENVVLINIVGTVLQKVAEYLSANVLTVAVIDPERQQVHLYSDNETTVLDATDLLTFQDVLPGFEIVVGRLFD